MVRPFFVGLLSEPLLFLVIFIRCYDLILIYVGDLFIVDRGRRLRVLELLCNFLFTFLLRIQYRASLALRFTAIRDRALNLSRRDCTVLAEKLT